MNNEDITLTQREGVFVEGKRAFQEGKWRSCNPYTASSSILEQVWINGWDHGRRLNQLEERRLPNAILRPGAGDKSYSVSYKTGNRGRNAR